MEYVSWIAKGVSQTRAAQWVINKVRATVYPWVYYKWEANLIVESDNIWLGSLESACDRHGLKMHNVQNVVSAVYDINPIFPDDPELLYLKVPVIDKPTADIAKHFDRAIDFIDTAVKKKQGVLIHCVYGISRSSTLVCAYLVRKHGMSVKAAIEHVKKRRPQAEPNSGFLIQLEAMKSRENYRYYREDL